MRTRITVLKKVFFVPNRHPLCAYMSRENVDPADDVGAADAQPNAAFVFLTPAGSIACASVYIHKHMYRNIFLYTYICIYIYKR